MSLERLDKLLAQAEGVRIDGIPLARALLDEPLLDRLEKLLFNEAALTFFRQKVSRIEFIVDGPLPPELLVEPATKTEPIFKQVIGYGLCKACRLCIEVCPKHVYKDDGFGRPDRENRREEECTGGHQCRQCVDVCPEATIHIVLADAVFSSTLFVQIPNPYGARLHQASIFSPRGGRDFFVVNPLDVGIPLKLPKTGSGPGEDLRHRLRLWNEQHFNPILDLQGYPRHFVDSRDPEQDLKDWAREQWRDEALVLQALRILCRQLPELCSLRQGKYQLDEILHRIIDEVIHAGIDPARREGRELLSTLVNEAFVEEPFLGAKHRPIGGLLPPGTSLAWKTPYGDEIPDYVHMEKCLGPECGLCVTQCPEGGGGSNGAIRMVLQVPQGTVATLVRGLEAYLLKLDGSHPNYEAMETLTGRSPFAFEVDPDYCKACGICITCCPHDVIEPMTRHFDMRA